MSQSIHMVLCKNKWIDGFTPGRRYFVTDIENDGQRPCIKYVKARGDHGQETLVLEFDIRDGSFPSDDHFEVVCLKYDLIKYVNRYIEVKCLRENYPGFEFQETYQMSHLLKMKLDSGTYHTQLWGTDDDGDFTCTLDMEGIVDSSHIRVGDSDGDFEVVRND